MFQYFIGQAKLKNMDHAEDLLYRKTMFLGRSGLGVRTKEPSPRCTGGDFGTPTTDTLCRSIVPVFNCRLNM